MTNRRDPFDTLRDHNPVDPAALPDAPSPAARQLLAATTTQTRINVRRRRTIRRVAAVAAAALVASAATWLITRQDVTLPTTILCYENADPDSNKIGTRPRQGPTLEACHQFWLDGSLTRDDLPAGAIPQLQACVTDRGGLAVIPGASPEVCDQVGLARATPETSTVPAPATPAPEPNGTISRVDAVIEFQDRMVTYFNTAGCISIEQAAIEASDALADLGLDDWEITVRPSHPERPCASFGLDTDTRQVVLVPIPVLDD